MAHAPAVISSIEASHAPHTAWPVTRRRRDDMSEKAT
jgi:hypothetical protein